ncbi:cysteine--tRNA ligase [Alkalilimnicola sp. S0819]|uniref:cysteine--tRNA ligase n=1 Tax=Alkalilimnicola sp. S0819 TaxID=2613922 RepID=UPI001261DAA6|nr:cysteine--tRNA ligase [Alkalilimnicola sp. S0819]KAB7622570.1 cysteine--tRNA ligase [Alkalilimnicola sp. S0819]MPQ17457.1 cysteine--tRNA ligase [Alkalilimnicola sp. S0819]
MLQIYNSLSNTKERFTPLEPGKVRMYVCGMTVYDYCHLGHARAMVVFDMVVRHLRASGYQVEYVRNITDVDDKIIRRAAELGVDMDTLTARFIAAMHEDAAALGVLPPDQEPRATRAMPAIIDMITVLIDKGYAYEAGNGDVYYSVSRFERYGRLSGKRVAELRAGSRVEVGEAKRDPVDFALWKAARPDEPAWDSPWGRGRPGWHIECSAMSTESLGASFDIHGGGLDLQFPHHENEIAQSEAATGCHYANYWMHNGHVRINEEKMSKSLGNFFTVRDILARYRAEQVRYFLLASHYRGPLNYSDQELDGAGHAVERLYLALRGLPDAESPAQSEFAARFQAAMDDDFNTPGALAVLFELAREINRQREQDPARAASLGALLRGLGGRLGLLQEDPEQYLRGEAVGPGEDGLDDARIEALLAERTQARQDRDFATADRIRDQLQAQGVTIEDGAGGTTWRRA